MRIAVIIPCYRVKNHILNVLEKVGEECSRIYVVDDACPEHTGDYVAEKSVDPRVHIIRNPKNLGVGGAVMRGYEQALIDGMNVLVKIDGDNQMDPSLIPRFIKPIISGDADYTKGNRFFYLDGIYSMPKIRIFGNAVLSLITKVSSGYWGTFDPTNGFTAIHGAVAKNLSFGKISRDYFFESDLLFHLNTLRAVIIDIPMGAKYGNEESNMKIAGLITRFLKNHVTNTFKRIFYSYYLRDMSLASLVLPLGIVLFGFGLTFGIVNWLDSHEKGIATPTGTIMLSATSLLVGLQFILTFLSHDISHVPSKPIHQRLDF